MKKRKEKRSCNSFYFLCLKSNRKQTSILLYTNISKVHCLYKRRTKKQKGVYRDQTWVGTHASHSFPMVLRGSHFIITGTKQSCRVLCQVSKNEMLFITSMKKNCILILISYQLHTEATQSTLKYISQPFN